MANPLKNVGVKILQSFKTAVNKLTQVRAKRPKAAPAPAPITAPAKTGKQARVESAEDQATRRALWAIENALLHPEDRTAQEGRRKAIEYLSRAENLKKKGKLQDWNREKMAERWITSDLATQAGQRERKDKKLEIFNQNFNIDLTQRQADTIAALMETDSYQQLAETYEGIYGELIQAMGEAIEDQTDPHQIERTLNLFLQNDIEPEFDTFRRVLDLPVDEFNALEADLYLQHESLFYQNDDEYGQRERKEALIGKYIEWK